MRLQLCNSLPTKDSVKNSSNNGNSGSVHVINPAEKWRCDLCKGQHKSSDGKILRCLFHSTCKVFAEFSPQRKREYLNKNKLCLVCSLSLNDKKHKSPCYMTDRFSCKICLEKGDTSAAKRHHSELHMPDGNKDKKKVKKDNHGAGTAAALPATPVNTVTVIPPAPQVSQPGIQNGNFYSTPLPSNPAQRSAQDTAPQNFSNVQMFSSGGSAGQYQSDIMPMMTVGTSASNI